jgi:hypothetical protein
MKYVYELYETDGDSVAYYASLPAALKALRDLIEGATSSWDSEMDTGISHPGDTLRVHYSVKRIEVKE